MRILMPTDPQHLWQVDPSTAKNIQLALAKEIIIAKLPKKPDAVAGADVTLTPDRQTLIGGFVVFRWSDLKPITQAVFHQEASFPYIPGLLSFREIPVLLEAWNLLDVKPDLIFCDGQGIAHPRGFGLASHLGLLLKHPSIGCAKKRLVGHHQEVSSCRGSWQPLFLKNCTAGCPRPAGEKLIGCVLRTRDNIKPVFVSPGHLVDFDQAREFVLSACTKYRLPEPIRAAHRLVNEQRYLPPYASRGE
jgi:deoxyribonuclease V